MVRFILAYPAICLAYVNCCIGWPQVKQCVQSGAFVIGWAWMLVGLLQIANIRM